MSIEEYEETLKSLDRHYHTASTAAKVADALDDKVKYQRLAHALGDARRQVRLHYFEFEDAAKVAATAKPCKECGSV